MQHGSAMMRNEYFVVVCIIALHWQLVICAPDVNECLRFPPVCSQACRNTPGSFQCSCIDGYTLTDNTRCAADTTGPAGSSYLIYTQGEYIVKTPLISESHHESARVFRAKGTVTAIGIHVQEEKIYFSNSQDQIIRSVLVTGDNVKDVITNGLSSVYSIAVEWIAKNLYIADSGLHKILVCSISTTRCTAVISQAVHTPVSVAVDSIHGRLFWSDCGAAGKIEMSALDGSSRELLVLDNIQCATSLSLDLPLQTLYWTDAQEHIIEAVTVFGRNRRNLTHEYLRKPYAVAVFEDDVIFSSTMMDEEIGHETSIIASANKFTLTNMDGVAGELTDVPNELYMYQYAVQLPGVSVCDSAPCSHMCLLSGLSDKFTCVCPDGTTLSQDRRTCTVNWAVPSVILARRNQLLRLSLNEIGGKTYDVIATPGAGDVTALSFDWSTKTAYFGVNASDENAASTVMKLTLGGTASAKSVVLYSGLTEVTDIAIDWVSNNLYWTDMQRAVLEVGTLDGRAKTTILGAAGQQKLEKPRAVTVDVSHRRLFYSDCGARPYIGVCDLVGEHCNTAWLSAPIGCVADLFIDQLDGSLYWTDFTGGLISSVNLDGKFVKPLSRSLAPVSVISLPDRILWTDKNFRDVLYSSKDDVTQRERLAVGVATLGALVLATADTQPDGQNECSVGTGGCSHICVPVDNARRCLCPTGHKLTANQMTCMAANTDVGVLSSPPTTKITGGTSGGLRPGQAPSTNTATARSDTGNCIPEHCLSGGTCSVDENGVKSCKCRADFTGARCELRVTKVAGTDGVTMTSEEEHEENFFVWVAAVAGVLVVITVTLVLVVCCLKKRKARRASVDVDMDSKPASNPSYSTPAYNMQEQNRPHALPRAHLTHDTSSMESPFVPRTSHTYT